MPSRQYRLAAPIDSSATTGTRVLVLYRPNLTRPPSVRPRLIVVNDDDSSTRTVFLDEAKEMGSTTPIVSPARWWLVLPSLVLIMLVTAPSPLLMNDLLVRRYELLYGFQGSKEEQGTACRQSTSSPMRMHHWSFPLRIQQPTQDYNLVQNAVSRFNIKNSIATLIPAVIAFILLGSNCDTIGRRPLLFLPFVGKIIHYSLLLLVVAFDLSDAWIIVAHALEAVFGSIGLVMLSAFAYTTDCTSESTRTRAFLLIEIAMVIARIVPMLAVGLWLHRYLYTTPLSVCLALSVIGLLYVLFIQPESVESVRNVSLVRQLLRVRLKPIIHIVQVFLVKRPNKNRQKFVLITIVNILLLFALFGYLSIFNLYLYGRPFCLNSLSVSLLSAVQALAVCLLTLLATLGKQQLDHTYIPAVLGSLALVTNFVIFAFATKIWLLYIAACIGSLFFITMPVLRSMVTRLVEVNEYAIVFIAAGIVETLGHQIVGAVANGIYQASLNFFPGLVFLVLASIGLVPIIIMGYLNFLEGKKSNDTATDQKASATSIMNAKA